MRWTECLVSALYRNVTARGNSAIHKLILRQPLTKIDVQALKYTMENNCIDRLDTMDMQDFEEWINDNCEVS